MKNTLLLILSLFTVCAASAQVWTQLSDTPFERHHSNGFGYEGNAYVFEGVRNTQGPTAFSNAMWMYNPTFDLWTELDDFPGPTRRIAIGDDFNEKYYYGFGLGTSSYLTDLWEFDPADMSFTQLPSCPCIGRSHPAFVAHNDKVFMGSGTSDNGDLKDWWEYDMQTQVWTQKADIPGDDRHHPFQFAMGDFIYVGGGHALNWSKYDMINETWSPIDDFPDGRVAGSQFSYQGKGYVIGGDDQNHVHVSDATTFLQYDPEEDEWNALPELPLGSRWANSSLIIDSLLYYFGGLSDNFSNDVSMWVFDMSIYNAPADTTSMDTTAMDTTMVDTTATFIAELDQQIIQASPNPFTDVIQLSDLAGTRSSFDLLVFNSQGKLVMKQSNYFLNEDVHFDKDLDRGVYIISLKGDSGNHILKILKE